MCDEVGRDEVYQLTSLCREVSKASVKFSGALLSVWVVVVDML